MLYLKKLSSFLSLKYNELKHRVFRITSSTISGILNEASLKPHRIRYYLEKRNENFEEKMRPVLIACKKV